ncbi:MAG: Gfo/Idh/MocA family oxidoreductase [Victivallales bacterium]|nr:Gfo/Idh/MocA family oxidoreductase [Victivallales bacterium]
MKFAVVGTGNMVDTYVTAMRSIDEMSITGLVTRNKENAEGKIATHPELADAEIAASISELSNDFDAVIICTPNGTHHPHCLEAARLGKHVFTEKPLEVTVERMDEMIIACVENGVKLGVAFQRRMSPDNLTMRKLLSEGALGRVFAADLCVKFFRGQESYYDTAEYRGTCWGDGGGALMMQGSHNVDIYCWLFGMPEGVMAMTDTFVHNLDVEDHAAVLLRHSDGMIGTIIVSTATKPGFKPKLEIHSDKGSVLMENDCIVHWSIDGMENPAAPVEKGIHDGSTVAVTDTSGHESLLVDFIEAVAADREPLVSGVSSKLCVELILKIYDAAGSRCIGESVNK